WSACTAIYCALMKWESSDALHCRHRVAGPATVKVLRQDGSHRFRISADELTPAWRLRANSTAPSTGMSAAARRYSLTPLSATTGIKSILLINRLRTLSRSGPGTTSLTRPANFALCAPIDSLVNARNAIDLRDNLSISADIALAGMMLFDISGRRNCAVSSASVMSDKAATAQPN